MLLARVQGCEERKEHEFVLSQIRDFFDDGLTISQQEASSLSLSSLTLYGQRQGNLDLFHSPQFNIPLLSTTPQVTTIHDCAYTKFPEEFTSTGKKNPLPGHIPPLPSSSQRKSLPYRKPPKKI